MRCLSCSRQIDIGELCDDCIELSKDGGIIICATCGKLCRVFRYVDEDKSLPKILYSPTCHHCSIFGDTYYLYTNIEDAQKSNKINSNLNFDYDINLN